MQNLQKWWEDENIFCWKMEVKKNNDEIDEDDETTHVWQWIFGINVSEIYKYWNNTLSSDSIILKSTTLSDEENKTHPVHLDVSSKNYL